VTVQSSTNMSESFTPSTASSAVDGGEGNTRLLAEYNHPKLAWLDLLWLLLLGGLAIIPPTDEIHKQLILAGIGVFQLLERYILKRIRPARARAYVVLIKILLATLLIGHTEEIPINSSYYLIYYLPVVTAATLYGILGTVLWTTLTSVAYCSYLIPALQLYELTSAGLSELVIRNLFFFLAAVLVNRFITEVRRQTSRYQALAQTLTETNRKLAEAQEEARRSERLAALGQLSAGLAHEIRNPLGVIKGSAEMLSRKLQGADSVAAELAGYISSEVNRLNGLVSRFLDFARPLKPELQVQELIPILERALQAGELRWPQSKVVVRREYVPALPQVLVDAGLCEQVFANLITNAYEAMPDGGTLTLTVAPGLSDGRPGVTIEIEDSGSGISPELHGQIFNPFFTTKKTGVGLGLSIVSKIVDDHRGWIRVMNTTGKGACFQVFLPAGEAR
jgi:two-component system, NtrC family, sensor histidine kinase HydH